MLADLPDAIVADLRRQFTGRDVLPSSMGERPPGVDGDRVVTTLPLAPGGPTLVEVPGPTAAAPTARDPAPPATGAPPGDDPPPATAPATPRRGLLPLLPDLPLRIPLLSE